MRIRKSSLIAWCCGILAASIFPATAAPPEYIVSQATTVNVAGQSVQLSAGKSVNVISITNGMAMIRVTLPDGSVSPAQIPMADLQAKQIQSMSPAPTPAKVHISECTIINIFKRKLIFI